MNHVIEVAKITYYRVIISHSLKLDTGGTTFQIAEEEIVFLELALGGSDQSPMEEMNENR